MYNVKQSAIHGKGLFAAAPIAKGTLLGHCQSKPTQHQGFYTLSLPNGELREITCALKYINHSKQPNVSYYDDLTVMALKDIAEGEELLHDYGDEWP